jgi:hypothetical protein
VLIGAVLLVSLAAAPVALATTQTASSGNVSATFTFGGSYSSGFTGERLTISRAGTVAYDHPVASKFCYTACAPGAPTASGPSLHVFDLEPGGERDVVLDLFSGGAHCCSIEQIFSLDGATGTYAETERNFGDPGEQILDLGHNGRFEFLTADDSFAYEFTDYAASGMPIQILTFSARRFRDVTRSYPTLIRKDAAGWLGTFKSLAKDHYRDSVGVIAAWAADEDLLGHQRLVSRFLAQQLKAGHLNSALSPQEPGGKRFVSNLQRFLRKHGYLC